MKIVAPQTNSDAPQITDYSQHSNCSFNKAFLLLNKPILLYVLYPFWFMPPLKTHCAISMKRTGNDFAELHRWIDEPTRELGYEHRIERHHFNEDDKNTIKRYWGEKAVIEWLFHIAIDNLVTAFKMSSQRFSYGHKAYNLMEFGLNKSGFIHCDFKRVEEHELQYIFDDGSEEGYY